MTTSVRGGAGTFTIAGQRVARLGFGARAPVAAAGPDLTADEVAELTTAG